MDEKLAVLPWPAPRSYPIHTLHVSSAYHCLLVNTGQGGWDKKKRTGRGSRTKNGESRETWGHGLLRIEKRFPSHHGLVFGRRVEIGIEYDDCITFRLPGVSPHSRIRTRLAIAYLRSRQIRKDRSNIQRIIDAQSPRPLASAEVRKEDENRHVPDGARTLNQQQQLV